jgi:hypothetical protein
MLSVKNTKPYMSPLYNPAPEQLREYIKERQAADVAAAAAAQVEEEDTKEDDEEEVLATMRIRATMRTYLRQLRPLRSNI